MLHEKMGKSDTEQRSISGGSKLIEQTLQELKDHELGKSLSPFVIHTGCEQTAA